MRNAASIDNPVSSAAIADEKAGRATASAATSGSRPANSFLPPATLSSRNAGQLAALSSPPGEGAADPLAEQHARWKAARERMRAPVNTATVPIVRRRSAEIIHLPASIQNAAPPRKPEHPDAEWFYHGLRPPTRGEGIREILRRTGFEHRLAVSALTGAGRSKHLVFARYIAMHRIAKAFPGMSSPQIGEIFNLDHTSVLFALGHLERKPKRLAEILEAV